MRKKGEKEKIKTTQLWLIMLTENNVKPAGLSFCLFYLQITPYFIRNVLRLSSVNILCLPLGIF